ncbi:PaaI family thioesterase [Marinovum sp. 2_MG-2023]|uniref:PaaI family thioesterase n=1 Tax=unclassified Marinovum TaxID=2647166 RepID=UPI0026E377F8|nr:MULTISPECIES: PaaI family thioesterase [unclassified Marinovum]MDO6732324.1 PaaI family thioesterase [Marinovum sp. 2_MG-2023]MDO6781641.1 PaaI family thioesterase [Marinovum sp. 1_MG-2023]
MTDDTPANWEAPSLFATHIGMKLVEWGPEFARIEVPLAEFTQNRHGAPHGGIHAALLDTCMGYSGCFTGVQDDRQMCLTLNLSVNYLSRPLGGVLIGEGRKTGGGKRTFFAEGRVEDDTGLLIATATGVFRYRG